MYIKLYTNGLSHIVADSKKLFTCVLGSRTYTVLSLKNELFISKTTPVSYTHLTLPTT